MDTGHRRHGGETDSRYNLCTTWHYKTQPQPSHRQVLYHPPAHCAALTSESANIPWLLITLEIWVEERGWHQGALTALSASQSCKVGPDNLSCQSYFVSISVSAVPGGLGLWSQVPVWLQPPLSNPGPTRAQHFTWSVKTSGQPPDWKGSAELRSQWPSAY